jgi:hypothetical protein
MEKQFRLSVAIFFSQVTSVTKSDVYTCGFRQETR